MAGRNMARIYGLGENIRNARLERGMTMNELAIAMGSDKAALSRIETGTRVPSIETVARISDELDMPMESLFAQETSEQTETMKQFMESRKSRLDKLSPEQLASLQASIDIALSMAGV